MDYTIGRLIEDKNVVAWKDREVRDTDVVVTFDGEVPFDIEDIEKILSEMKLYAQAGSDGACVKCGSTKEVTFGPDPYQSDINDDHTPIWMCWECRCESAGDT